MSRNLKQLDSELTDLKKDFDDSQKWLQTFKGKIEAGYGKMDGALGTAAGTGISGEVTGASLGLKLFNYERTLFDVQEWMDKRNGLAPVDIKATADRAAAAVDRMYPVLVRLNTEFPDVKGVAQRAHQRLDRIQPKVGALESSLRSIRSRAAHNVAASSNPRADNISDASDASRHIQQLENRINGLIAALG